MRRSSKFGDIAEENEVEKTSNVNNRDSESAKSPDVEEDKLDATGIAGAMGFTSTDIFMSAAKGHLKKLKSIYKQDPTIIYHRDENVRNHLCLYSNEKNVNSKHLTQQLVKFTADWAATCWSNFELILILSR